jgi:4-carboxymuconolactone decarboxylase
MNDHDRLPPLAPETWTDEQRGYAQEIIDGPRGALVSPFVPLLRSPELMAHAGRMGEYLRYRSAIGRKLSELAILVTARHWTQQVEWAIHVPIAIAQGIAASVVADIAAGRRPASLDEEGLLVYDFCMELHRDHGVADATWQRAIERFGEQGAIDLVGINGYYALLSMVMNAARTAVPASSAQPLPKLAA